jgi:hypothetical protein
MQPLSKKIDGITLHHKDKITCRINSTVIKDAQIAIEENRIYICQNIKNGNHPNNSLGYIFGWEITSGIKDNQVTEIKIKSYHFKIGTILTDKNNNKRKILDICQNVYYLSKINKFNQFEFELTPEDMSIAYPN